jgi:hypothetical protein
MLCFAVGLFFRAWWQDCGFAEETLDICYTVEDGEGETLGSTAQPGLTLFGSEAVRNVSFWSAFLTLKNFSFTRHCKMGRLILVDKCNTVLMAVFLAAFERLPK